jgi:hypothetical protein
MTDDHRPKTAGRPSAVRCRQLERLENPRTAVMADARKLGKVVI